MRTFLFLCAFFLLSVSSFAGDNKVIDYDDLVKGNYGIDAPVKTLSESVLIRVSGCPTLQGGFDGKNDNKGGGEFWVVRHNRNDREICSSVGSGCLKCEKLSEK